MARLPIIGSDSDQWGMLLNDFLRVAHHENGTLRGVMAAINVKDFGAVGDGVADDTVAIQQATDVSREVFFPSGTYRTTQPINLSKNGQIIFGPGTIKTSAKFVFYITVPLLNVILRDLTMINQGRLEGGYDDAAAIYSEAIEGAGVEHSHFLNLTIIGFGQGFSISGTGRPDRSDFFTDLSRATFSDSATMLGPHGRNVISGCRILDTLSKKPIGTGGGHGIYVRGGYFQITNNQIENMQGGILAPTYGVVSGNIILNAWYDSGIYLTGDPKSWSAGVSIIGNYIENTKVDGIAVSGSEQVTIVGNTIANARQGSIRLQNAWLVTITGNTCLAMGNSDHFIRGYGSEAIQGSREVLISNNIFRGPTSKRSNPIVFAKAAAPHRGIVISDNIFFDLDTSSLSNEFFGPYAIINIQHSLTEEAAQGIIAQNNLFSSLARLEEDQNKPGYPYIRGATYITGNLFLYK
ncbi:MAG: glycosyl hydrolase family 28-related protein [Caldilineaceae bacterium]